MITTTRSRTHRHARISVILTVVAAATLLLAGCGSSGPPSAPPLLLSGPTTNIVAAIPAGWHQVINSANPIIPEMVTPTDCMGATETACATGLARIATTTAPTAEQASNDVAAAVTTEPGVTAGPITSRGPGPVGQRDGYRQRFSFTNSKGAQTAEVAAVPSGPTTPDAQGNREYSVVLVWSTDTPSAPAGPAIDRIVESVLVHGGESKR